MYFLTGGGGALVAGTNTVLKWLPTINTLTNLTYNNTTGIFTNVATDRRRFAFSMEVGLTTTASAISNQADIWFQINNTDVNSGTGRRGQKISVYPTGYGVTQHILSTTWIFSLAANDTILTAAWCDSACSVGSLVFGNTASARLTVVEV
jgi:hypothetical protein